MKYTLPKNSGELSKLIESAIRSAKTMRDKIQIAAIAILHHAYQCGDYTKANDLINGLGHGLKRDSLVEFFVKFGGLIVDSEEPNQGFTSWQGKKHIQDHFDEAKATMWYELKKDANPFEGYNLEDELRKFITKANKRKRMIQAMTEDEQAKCSFEISDEAMNMLITLTGFEAILDDDEPDTVQVEIDALEAELAKTA